MRPSFLLPHESLDEFNALAANLAGYYIPLHPVAREWVFELAIVEWRLRRIPEIEANLLAVQCAQLADEPGTDEVLKNELQFVAVAWARLTGANIIHASVVLNSLHAQEMRLVRRANALRKLLQPAPAPSSYVSSDKPPLSRTQEDPEPTPAPPPEESQMGLRGLRGQPDLSPVSPQKTRHLPAKYPSLDRSSVRVFPRCDSRPATKEEIEASSCFSCAAAYGSHGQSLPANRSPTGKSSLKQSIFRLAAIGDTGDGPGSPRLGRQTGWSGHSTLATAVAASLA